MTGYIIAKRSRTTKRCTKFFAGFYADTDKMAFTANGRNAQRFLTRSKAEDTVAILPGAGWELVVNRDDRSRLLTDLA